MPPTPFWTAETQFYADFGSKAGMRCSFCEFLHPEPFIMGCLYTCEPANHTHMNTWSWSPRNVGGILDLRWDPGVDHDFDAAECTLTCVLRGTIAKAANGNFKLCKKQTISDREFKQRARTEFQARVWGTRTDSACWHLRLACSVHICGASSICPRTIHYWLSVHL